MAIGHDGELASPSGLAVDRVNKRLYVADAARHHILSYSTVDGTPVRTIGKRGSEPGEFNFPTNLAVDAGGRLYVTDTLNFRIQIFDADGEFVTTFGTLGDAPGCLNRPKGIGVDSEGHIYVIDASFNNFQIFDERDSCCCLSARADASPGEFFLPAGLYIDERDRIYVADQGNSRVQVFQYVRAGDRGRDAGGSEQMRKALVLAGMAVLMAASTGYAQFTATIAGGPHDLSNGSAVRNSNATINGQTCVFCHVPHSGSTNMPLWNRSSPTGAAYQVYTSSTSKSVATPAGRRGRYFRRVHELP